MEGFVLLKTADFNQRFTLKLEVKTGLPKKNVDKNFQQNVVKCPVSML